MNFFLEGNRHLPRGCVTPFIQVAYNKSIIFRKTCKVVKFVTFLIDLSSFGYAAYEVLAFHNCKINLISETLVDVLLVLFNFITLNIQKS